MATRYSPGQVTSDAVTAEYSPHQVQSGVASPEVPEHTSGSAASHQQAEAHAAMHQDHGHTAVHDASNTSNPGTHSK